MYRPSDPQKGLFDVGGLLPPEKRERCEHSWAGPFRRQALPILRKVEDEFADLFHPELGRPNRPVELVLGVLILKEMSDLTDQEALEALEYDVRWWYAFEREPHDLHLCQKTLHNFRVGLIEKDKSRVAFERVTDELIGALGVNVSRQRLDSTQILSNFAVLTRLGLFCETIRVFLKQVKQTDEATYHGLGLGILKRHAEESRYRDARWGEGPRRLGVVARDLWRLIKRFENDERIRGTQEWALLKRLFEEQCELVEGPQEPRDDDDDQADGSAPVVLKESGKISSGSLQTPHDPQVSYSGHKGKGYAMQVAETCVAENDVQLITHVQVTPACQSDVNQTVPTVEALEARGQKPQELVADTNYSGAENAAALARQGVRLTAPAAPIGKPDPAKEYPEPAAQCPQDPKQAVEWLRRQQASAAFKERYAIRAGIEATNSELHRAHGTKKLRVRGGSRVNLAACFKALGCNLKRALRCWLAREATPQATAVPA